MKSAQKKQVYKIAINSDVLRQIRQHARSQVSSEICGVLIGNQSGNRLEIEACIQGANADQAGTHVTFTQDTWQHIFSIKDKTYPNDRIAGWYHSHPGFGVFLSDHDTFIHKNFFSSEDQVAWVYDPVSDEEGCFVWRDGEIIRAEQVEVIDPRGGEQVDERSEPALGGPIEVSEKAVRDVTAQPEQVSSYMRWFLTVILYLSTFMLGTLFSMYFLPTVVEKQVQVPIFIDPYTGTILDPQIARQIIQKQLTMQQELMQKLQQTPGTPGQKPSATAPNAPQGKDSRGK
jgi:proteasome lid subunit RPN8/RPN11